MRVLVRDILRDLSRSLPISLFRGLSFPLCGISLCLVHLCLVAMGYAEVFSQQPPPPKTSNPPRHVVLVIGDGMGLSQLSAGLYGKKEGLTSFQRFTHVGLMSTHAYDTLITDSAAGATAFATGHKTRNGYISVSPEGAPWPTLLEQLSAQGLATGIVVTSSITHATPACFYAHARSRRDYEAIAEDLVESVESSVDLFVGGGKKYFSERQDGKNLLQTMESKGVYLAPSLEAFSTSQAPKLGFFTADEEPPPAHKGRRGQLKQAVTAALEKLSKREKGFFLLVEASQIDWAGHDNDTEYLLAELRDLEETLATILDFAVKDTQTLVLLTADHETGGFSVLGPSASEETFAGRFSTEGHTATWVPVLSFGPGALDFSGLYDNTDIYHKILRIYAR